MIDYTVVLGIDLKTIEYLKLVVPTWIKHKPSLLERPFVIFYDGVSTLQIDSILKLPRSTLVSWPPAGVTYERDGLTKWTNPQRAKMLAGFVHVPAWCVQTPYWFKIDLDAVATGMDDWVQESWFDGNPSIIAPNWNYSKPPDIMTRLDNWADQYRPIFLEYTQPFNLVPELGSDLVRHERIASWCSFYSTEFTKIAAAAARRTCGIGQIPVDSQDSFHFYCARRAGFTIRKVNMKRFGWQIRSSYSSVKESVEAVLR